MSSQGNVKVERASNASKMITSLRPKMALVVDHKNSTIAGEKHRLNNAIGRNQVGELDAYVQLDSAKKKHILANILCLH